MAQNSPPDRSLAFNLVVLLSLVFIILGATVWTLVIPTTASDKKALNDYYDEINVNYEGLSIPVSEIPEIDLKGLIFWPEDAIKADNGTIPTIIHVNGIDNRLDEAIKYAITFVKMGFVFVIIEGRGTGQSEEQSDFHGEEPSDIPKVIDYLSINYPFINSTHIAGSGFSYGAGVMLIAQAIEERIFTSILFHPLTNVSQFLEEYQRLSIGETLSTDASPQPNDELNQDAFGVCNDSNTHNLLILHVEDESVAGVNDTINFFDYINGTERDDCQLVLRPDVSVQENEANITSRKYAMAWLDHYYFNSSIDITTLSTEMEYQTPFLYDPPKAESAKTLSLIGLILIELGAWLGFRFFLYQIEKKKEAEKAAKRRKRELFDEIVDEIDEFQKEELAPEPVFKQFILEAMILWVSSAIIGFAATQSQSNVFFGFYIGLPLLSMVGFHYIRKKEEGKRLIPPWEEIKPTVVGILFAIVPIILGLALYDYNARKTLQEPISPWNPATVFYFMVFFMIFLWCYKILEFFVDQNRRLWLALVLIVIIITVWIYSLFVPIGTSDDWVVNFWLYSAIGFGIFMMGLVVIFYRKLWGNAMVGLVFIAVVISTGLIIQFNLPR